MDWRIIMLICVIILGINSLNLRSELDDAREQCEIKKVLLDKE